MQTTNEINLIPTEFPYDINRLTEQLNKPETQVYIANQIEQQIYNGLSNNSVNDIPLRNPNKRTEQLLEENNKELYSIHYEDMKTNAHLLSLLKVVDSQNEELERLKSVNQELQKVNNILEEECKYSTRNTVIWSIITGVVLLGIEHWKDIYNLILSLIK